MDNLSHSVAGLLAGEIVHRSLPVEAAPEQQRLRRRLLLIGCCLASNFPDLDLVATPLLPAPLGYLLHHRGHTHTALYALPQALLLAALLWLLWPAARRLLRQSGAARAGLAGVLAIGFGLHLLMDYLNSYGLHPFHPFDSRWIYGDMVFILEPVFWTAFGVPVIMTLQAAWLRRMLLGLLAAALAYFTWRGFLPWQSLFLLLAMGGLLAWLQSRAAPGRRGALVAAALFGIGFVMLQSGARLAAHERIAALLRQRDPAARLVDAAMTAFPATPACWSVVALESREDRQTYRVSSGVVRIAPAWMPAALIPACPAALIPVPPTGSAAGQAGQAAPEVLLLGQESASLARLRQLARDDCHFNAWMRYARMPVLQGERAWDARYASGLRDNFTSIDLADFAGRDCERRVPQWQPPRADLLAAPRPAAPLAQQ